MECSSPGGCLILTILHFVLKQDEQEEISASLLEQHWEKKLPEPLSWRSDEEDEDSDFGEEQRDCYLKVLHILLEQLWLFTVSYS